MNGHNPKYSYDCNNCKLSWNCGPTCQCDVHRWLGTEIMPTPEGRKRQVNFMCAAARLTLPFNMEDN